tara:strand:+ start:4401 stop:4583 length:183 start_codon:yes stop_codon:yes gene_type:complete
MENYLNYKQELHQIYLERNSAEISLLKECFKTKEHKKRKLSIIEFKSITRKTNDRCRNSS